MNREFTLHFVQSNVQIFTEGIITSRDGASEIGITNKGRVLNTRDGNSFTIKTAKETFNLVRSPYEKRTMTVIGDTMSKGVRVLFNYGDNPKMIRTDKSLFDTWLDEDEYDTPLIVLVIDQSLTVKNYNKILNDLISRYRKRSKVTLVLLNSLANKKQPHEDKVMNLVYNTYRTLPLFRLFDEGYNKYLSTVLPQYSVINSMETTNPFISGLNGFLVGVNYDDGYN